jgi:hypothetical protein
MKIQLSPASVPPPNEGSPNTQDVKASSAHRAETVRVGQLHQLINTWAKVESSQLLDPAKAQHALVALKNPHSAPITPQEKSAVLERQLMQLQLSTAKGLLNILSPRLYDKGTMLLISKNAQGQWQLQSPAPPLSLTALSHQFRDLSLATGPLPLFNTPAASSALADPLSALSATLSHALQSNEKIDISGIKKALASSGQFFENSLRPNSPAAAPVNTQKSLPSIDISASLKKVESQLQKWINALPVSLKKAPPQTANPAGAVQAASAQPQTVTIGAVKLSDTAQNIHSDNQTAHPRTTTQDSKAWLIQLQQQLFKDWKQQAMNPVSQASLTTAQQTLQSTHGKHVQPNMGPVINAALNEYLTTSASPLKSEGVTSALLLEWLLAPKTQADPKALPVWPQNLSAQQQVHKILQSMVLLITDNQAAPDEPANQLLRQLLNVSQSLSRIQGEQINNRLVMQQQPDNVQLNFSLPYLHQQSMHWCELELAQDSSTESENKKTLGWHLVLRFAQDTEDAFAIESYLNTNQLQLTLWAQQQQALAKLSSKSTLLREKLTRAGFEVENIQSKRGNPSKSSRQVHQSMIDVHT